MRRRQQQQQMIGDMGCPTPRGMQDGRVEVVKMLLAHDQIDANVATTDDTSETLDTPRGVRLLLLAHDGIDAIKAEADGNTLLHVAFLHRVPTACWTETQRAPCAMQCVVVYGASLAAGGSQAFTPLALRSWLRNWRNWLHVQTGLSLLSGSTPPLVGRSFRLLRGASFTKMQHSFPEAASGALAYTGTAETSTQVLLLLIEIWLVAIRFFKRSWLVGSRGDDGQNRFAGDNLVSDADARTACKGDEIYHPRLFTLDKKQRQHVRCDCNHCDRSMPPPQAKVRGGEEV